MLGEEFIKKWKKKEVLMKGLWSGIDAVATGYSVVPAEMRFAPSGKAVTTLRIGCGGNEKVKGTFLEIVTWEKLAEEVNKMVEKKGIAVKAEGVIRERKWQYKDKWYSKLEMVWLRSLEIQKGEKLVSLEIPAYNKEDVKGDST